MSDRVPRETPAPPLAAVTVFGPVLPGLLRYAELLAGPAILAGCIGPHEAGRLWERHLLNCAVAVSVVPPAGQAADVGSGAGLPGLVWALMRPDAELTLVEPLHRRVDFLQEAVAVLQLDNVTVVRARAEELHGSHQFDLVAARAVAPLKRLIPACLPLVRRTGSLVALKGATALHEIDEARPQLRRVRATSVVVTTYGEGIVSPPTTAVIVRTERGTERGKV